MKILHTADWHLGTFRSPVKDGVNLRTEDTKRCLNELVRAAKEERPDYSLISGDVFHVGRLGSERCCEEIITAIHYIRELAMVSGQVVVMRGTPNHDGAGQFNVLGEMFADSRNVHIVTTPQVLSFYDADIAVLPGFDSGIYRTKFPGLSKEDENAAVTNELANIVTGLKAQCRQDKTSILMAHYTVPGCNTESGQTMMMTQFEPVIPQEALLVADYDLVALGHIHRPQRILSNSWYYSGAVNAINFNDAGQERGFWLHTDLPFGGWDSSFIKTPIREFKTICLDNEDISQLNAGAVDMVATYKWRGEVDDKIVRIHYTCSAENSKALNTALLEKELLDDGAFMVWEILPEKIAEFANRQELANTTDPEENLIRYLEEKQLSQEEIQELVLKARPVISEAEAGMTAAINTGIFEPVEITVKNYRNYEEEHFSFENISFCTINGQNGAGKSSLFMDAIIDCLYEEPREGELTGWIRNDEKARSGAIIFTFRIGEKTYRVTRTRARSGKGTLNIAQLVDGDWKDCSKERYNDTQQEIVDILGMDSLTFKSCALIMQDQYGLFLQAKPEERIEVLGTLLGLGVYQAMEKIAQDKAKTNAAKNRELKQEIEIHSSTISQLGNPDEALAACQAELAGYERSLQAKIAERDHQKLILANQQAAAERRTKLLASITTLQSKKAATEQNRDVQQAIIKSSTEFLDGRNEIMEKVAEYNSMVEKEKTLAAETALYLSKKNEAEELARQAETERLNIDGYAAKIKQKEYELILAQPTEQDSVIREKAAEYERKKAELEELQEKAVAYQQAKTEHSVAVFHHDETAGKFDTERKSLDEQKKVLEKKVEILGESGCVDIDNAHCRFLQDAIEAREKLARFDVLYADIAARRDCELAKSKQVVDKKYAEMHALGFDAAALTVLQTECAALFPYASQLETIKQRESKIVLLKADIENLRVNMLEVETRLAAVRQRADAAAQERDGYAKSFEEHTEVESFILMLKPWLEKEKQLSVEEVRRTGALDRVSELSAEIEDLDREIAEKQTEIGKEEVAMCGIEELTGAVAKMNAEVDAVSALVREQQMKLGALRQKSEQAASLKQQIAALNERQTEYAKEASDYEILKTAFSQNGVPHQIIRSIIPQLTATSNTIFGQMTGGKMGVEFRLERLQKNGKEKVSLDIFIEEYGKLALPYLSKSGGEKVKSSLSVILALAELKSSSAGIQLGMLFIDEPPFLDSDGVEAYCDALETIQGRYRNIKIMAITHDPTMKARFPQNIDVVKTENGSRVIY